MILNLVHLQLYLELRNFKVQELMWLRGIYSLLCFVLLFIDIGSSVLAVNAEQRNIKQ
jgi:hypothetical protein